MESVQNTRGTWEERIRAFKLSGQNAAQWCRENDVPANQLRYRLRKEREQNPHPGKSKATWIAVPTSASSSSSGVSLRIGTVDVKVDRGFDPDVLSEVIRALLEEC